MRFPGLTTRGLMALIAVVGLGLGLVIGVWRLEERRREYRRLVMFHAWNEAAARGAAAEGGAFRSGVAGPGLSPDAMAQMLRYADREARLKRVYERTARYPWLPVPPPPLK